MSEPDSAQEEKQFIDQLVGFVASDDLSDAEVGDALLVMVVQFQLGTLGYSIETAPPEVCAEVVAHLARVDTLNPRLTALEKAIKLAASGDAPRAGSLFRNLMWEGAAVQQAETYVARKKEQARQYGESGARENAKTKARNRREVRDAALQLLSGRHSTISARELARRIAPQLSIGETAIRSHISYLEKAGEITLQR